LKAFGLEPLDDRSDLSLLDGVGLDDGQRTF
jgi:hypothetical protein